jgi:heavy metal sensor kinase
MLLLGGGVALSIGLFGGWLISARVLQPLAAISSAASSISATNLSRRIDCSQIDRELTDLADVLNQMFERLQSAFERQARFTADASHELRTPLSILYTNLQLALSRPRTEAEYRETIESGLRAAARMRSLIDGLLMLARADAGRLDIPWQPVDLNEIAAEVVEQFASLAERAQVHLLAERAPQSVFVTGEASMLARIAANLVSNAIRHTPAEGRIRVSVKTDGKQALLAVADTGCGIALEDQPKLFERFYRADAARARATGGCGLGLAISKSLAEAHHGTIGITSRPERGTCFVVRLPLAAGEIRPQKRVTLDDQR